MNEKRDKRGTLMLALLWLAAVVVGIIIFIVVGLGWIFLFGVLTMLLVVGLFSLVRLKNQGKIMQK